MAGDLLPDADQDSRVGSAFNRLLLSTDEGGAQAKDYEARMLTDRVRAIGATWLLAPRPDAPSTLSGHCQSCPPPTSPRNWPIYVQR